MPLSNLMLTILEQAIEPLKCLHGAGYFTEEEWSQLDLIMNKKHIWTTGPDRQTQRIQPSVNGANRNALSRHEALSSDFQAEVDKINLSPEIFSICTSAELSTDDILTPAASMDVPWELSPAMASPAPSRIIIKNQGEFSRLQGANELVSSFPRKQAVEPQAFNPSLMNNTLRDLRKERISEGPYTTSRSNTTMQHKSVSSWASEVLNGSFHRSDARPVSRASGFSSELVDISNLDQSIAPSISTINSYSDDVNAFETNNAAEWDEIPSQRPKKQSKDDISALINEKFDKIAKIIIQEKRVSPQIQANITAAPPRPEIRNTLRTATTSRSTRRKETKEPKDRPTNPPPKTKTCWFWAESAGGCRYRPEECLNLHVKPEPGNLPEYPLKDGKPTWGCLADAAPQEVPIGKRPKTCWFWAARGSCGKGGACEYVHGWVSGGVASRPPNVNFITRLRYKITDDDEPPEMFSINDNEFDLDERDVGDKAPGFMVDMDLGAIKSRIHAPEWFASKLL